MPKQPGPHRSIDSLLIHEGEPHPRISGAIVMPIFQSANFMFGGPDGSDQVRYVRYNNTPNQEVLGTKLAALEAGESAIVTASGMAAITTSLLAILEPGDHLLAQRGLYAGTHDFITKHLPRLGITFDLFDGDDPESWPDQLRPKTRAIYVEPITNPLMEVADLEAVVAFARSQHLVSMIDNTFATPVNFRPIEWGFDLSIHSATKYLNGHSDIAAGAVIGSQELVERIGNKLKYLGGCLDPHAGFLLHRGLKTLALRVRCQNANALAIAGFLAHHPLVETVNHPSLPPYRERAQRLFDGFGGMISFEVAGGPAGANRLMERLTLPLRAGSLGGVETLMTRPAFTSHASMDPEERRHLGIKDNLIRLSVGIEGTEELIHDFDRALSQLETEVAS